MIRATGILAIGLLLSSCGKPEVAVCEDFIKSSLRSPSGYRQVDVTIYDSAPMAPAAFWAEAGLPDPARDPSTVIRLAEANRIRGHQISRRDVFIHYDAPNAYGVPVRGVEKCAFRLIDGQLPSREDMDIDASIAVSRAGMRRLVEDGGVPGAAVDGEPRPGFACCLRSN